MRRTTKSVDVLARAAYRGTLTVWEARCLLESLCHDSQPKPMLRCDDLGRDATTVADLVELQRIAEGVICNAPQHTFPSE